MSQVPYRLRYAARPLTFVRYRGCCPRFLAAFTPPPPHPTPSPHTPRGTLQMLMQWKTMYMPLLHKSNRQLFGYFFHMRQPGRVGQSVSRLIQEQEIPVQYPDRPQ